MKCLSQKISGCVGNFKIPPMWSHALAVLACVAIVAGRASTQASSPKGGRFPHHSKLGKIDSGNESLPTVADEEAPALPTSSNWAEDLTALLWAESEQKKAFFEFLRTEYKPVSRKDQGAAGGERATRGQAIKMFHMLVSETSAELFDDDSSTGSGYRHWIGKRDVEEELVNKMILFDHCEVVMAACFPSYLGEADPAFKTLKRFCVDGKASQSMVWGRSIKRNVTKYSPFLTIPTKKNTLPIYVSPVDESFTGDFSAVVLHDAKVGFIVGAPGSSEARASSLLPRVPMSKDRDRDDSANAWAFASAYERDQTTAEREIARSMKLDEIHPYVALRKREPLRDEWVEELKGKLGVKLVEGKKEIYDMNGLLSEKVLDVIRPSREALSARSRGLFNVRWGEIKSIEGSDGNPPARTAGPYFSVDMADRYAMLVFANNADSLSLLLREHDMSEWEMRAKYFEPEKRWPDATEIENHEADQAKLRDEIGYKAELLAFNGFFKYIIDDEYKGMNADDIEGLLSQLRDEIQALEKWAKGLLIELQRFDPFVNPPVISGLQISSKINQAYYLGLRMGFMRYVAGRLRLEQAERRLRETKPLTLRDKVQNRDIVLNCRLYVYHNEFGAKRVQLLSEFLKRGSVEERELDDYKGMDLDACFHEYWQSVFEMVHFNETKFYNRMDLQRRSQISNGDIINYSDEPGVADDARSIMIHMVVNTHRILEKAYDLFFAVLRGNSFKLGLQDKDLRYKGIRVKDVDVDFDTNAYGEDPVMDALKSAIEMAQWEGVSHLEVIKGEFEKATGGHIWDQWKRHNGLGPRHNSTLCGPFDGARQKVQDAIRLCAQNNCSTSDAAFLNGCRDILMRGCSANVAHSLVGRVRNWWSQLHPGAKGFISTMGFVVTAVALFIAISFATYEAPGDPNGRRLADELSEYYLSESDGEGGFLRGSTSANT